MSDVLGWINFDSYRLNDTFDNIETLFSDLHMKIKANDIIEKLPSRCKENFSWDYPTGSIITNMLAIAKEIIEEEYPCARVKHEYKFGSYWLDVDDETQKLADERWEEEHE